MASYLGLQKDGKLYKFPNERTGSIKLYPESNSFFDFGRSIGGDPIRLWSHVRGCDSWTALRQIRECFGLNTPDRAHSRAMIEQQEQARKAAEEAKQKAKRRWVQEVDALKAEASFYQAILEGEHCKPLSWVWCTCQDRLTTAQIQLDLLCGIN